MPSQPDALIRPASAPLAVFGESWNCHVHVFGARALYPLRADRRYTPAPAGTLELLAHARRIGASRLVLIQPSPYGTDNRCLLDAMSALPDNCRAVLALGSDRLTETTMADLHGRGVRGIRVNPGGRIGSLASLRHEIRRIAECLAQTPWHLEVNCAPSVAAPLADLVADLRTPVVFDHLFGLDPAQGDWATARDATRALLRRERIWVKISGVDRVCRAPADRGRVEEVVALLVETAADRLVWGSDWPHTPLDGEGEAFRSVDDVGEAARMASLLAQAAAGIFVGNPLRLYS